MVRDLLKPETYIPEHRLLVRFDGKGFSVMSTACTYDLSALERQTRDGETVWESHTTDSLYSNEGKVLHGPSNQDLPYYELKIDSSEYGQGVKALYAFVGKQKEPSWRLVVE